MANRTIHARPGYGSSLRQQLEAAGWTQTRLASECDLSRQTISRAVNKDEVSDRTAERIAAALGRTPSSTGPVAMSNQAQGAKTKGDGPRVFGPTLCDATDLTTWAKRREAQELLPRVVRRLVLTTGRGVGAASIRSGEGVQLRGWDGIVKADEGTAFVPQGISGWEMGTGKNPRQKAARDIEKRTREPAPLTPGDSTFVFVTPRRFDGKDQWAAKEEEERPWRAVRVLDADSLEGWLETAPGIHIRLSILIGKTPPDAVDLESYWEAWAGATEPALTPSLLRVGRDDEIAEIRDLLGEASEPFAIKAESRGEAIAVLYAAIADLSADERERLLGRCVVAESPTAFRYLAAAASPLLIVPDFDPEGLASGAARTGHLVVVPLGQSDPGSGKVVSIPPLSRLRAAEELQELGLDHNRSYELAGLARRSLTAFRRANATSPDQRQPAWARPQVGRSLMPALLAGSWNSASSRDREVVAALAQRPYGEVEDELVRWSAGSDPALRRQGDAWYLVSHEDSWRLLSRYLNRLDLERFEEAALGVLATVNPAFDLPAEERWLAGLRGRAPQHSKLLARGFAETLTIMGALGEDLPSPTYTAHDAADRTVATLLDRANDDWRLWASLSTHLPALAEAAPDAFLDGVDAGLGGAEPVLGYMFADERSGLFPSSPHTGLLWALERLAWSPSHLGRVVRLLARLDRMDPGSELKGEEARRGRLSNRPLASLKAVFRSWLPQTAATLDERLEALDGLRRHESEVAWAVMRSMLPEHHASGSYSQKPSIRPWALEAGETVTRAEYIRTAREVVARLREDVGREAARWEELVEHLGLVSPDDHDAIVGDLADLDTGELEEDGKTQIWAALRKLVGEHRAYSSADWAMPDEYLNRLEEVSERFAPSDPVTLHKRLFGWHAYALRGGNVMETPREVQEAELEAARVKAVKSVLEYDGTEGLARLAQSVEEPRMVGSAVAKVDEDSRFAAELLGRHLAASNHALALFVHGYAAGQCQKSGEGWIISRLRGGQELTAEQLAALLHVLPPGPRAWSLADESGEAARQAYWRGLPIYGIAAEHLQPAVRKLVEAGRPVAATELLSLNLHRDTEIEPELAAEVLEAVISSDTEPDEPVTHFRHAVGELLDELVETDFDQTRVARLEWALLPVLDRFDRKPKALHRLLADSPEFFVEVVSLVYSAEGDDVEEVEETDRLQAQTGYSLLNSWRRVPGQGDDGKVDGTKLRDWVTAACTGLEQVGRSGIGHQVIGQVLSGCPSDEDGTWPCRAVREVIEALESADLETGLQTGVYNSRGATWRDPAEGGAQERALANRYEGFAAALGPRYARTARVLGRIAETYRRDARREDFESEMREDLGV